MVREPRLRATCACIRLRFGSGQPIHGEQGFLRIMRDYSRSPPQDITWNSAPSFENPTSGSATIANPEVTSTMGFGPAFTYPYAQPINFDQMMYPVSTQRLIVRRGHWLTLSRYRTCSRLGPRQCQRLVGRIFSSAIVLSSHKPKPSPMEIPYRRRHRALPRGRRTYLPQAKEWPIHTV